MSEVDLENAETHADLSLLTNEQLRSQLANQIALTAESLLSAAAIWTELMRRGVDLGAFRSGLAFYLPKIARRELAPEAVVTFAGQRTLLQSMIGMPLDQQRRFAAGDAIEIAEEDGNGKVALQQRRLAELSLKEVLLAIGDGRVRSFAEQRRSLLQNASEPTRQRRSTGSVVRIRAVGGLIHIGRTRLDPLDLAAALKTLGFELVRKLD